MRIATFVFIFFIYSLASNAQCTQKISAGAYHTLFIKSDGTLWQRGLFYHTYFVTTGHIQDYMYDYPIQLGTDTDWLDIQAGWFNSIALKNNGTLWQWQADQLPMQLGTDTDWRFISIGERRCAAIKTDGTLWIWNTETSSGLPNFSLPIQVGSDNDWKQVDCGYSTTYLAIKNNGTLWASGYNQSGQLGDGTIESRQNPVQITNTNDWLMVSCGASHTMALKTDHTLWTWGEQDQAQLGYYNPQFADQLTPRQVNSDTDWKSIAAGGENSVAIKNDNSLWIWGARDYGALANNFSTLNSLQPIQVGTGNWNSVIAGYFHFFAIKSDGTIWLWGRNIEKQLDLGTTNKSTPEIFDCNTLSNTQFDSEINFTLYPNPVNTILNIKNNNRYTINNIQVYDLLGQKVMEITNNVSNIDLSTLRKGIYILQITTDTNFNYKTKIIKD